MNQRVTDWLKHNTLALCAIVLALGAGGGYAVAASRSTSIHGCVVKKTGQLLVVARCSRGEDRLVWNVQGPQGLQGPQGAQGPTGASAPDAWAIVDGSGAIPFGQGHGLSAQRLSAGTYGVTVTDPSCSKSFNAPIVSVSDADPPSGETAGAFPTAWIEDSPGNEQFTVITGVIVGGEFTATDHTFNLVDAC